MSNAALLAEAIAATAWTVRGAWRGLSATLRAVQRRDASTPAHPPTRPAHAHTTDHDYQEAA